MAKNLEMMALYSDFEEAREAIIALKTMDMRSDAVEEMRLVSPVPHPELEDVIGTKPVFLQRFTFFGGLTGAICGFLLAAAVAQSMFTVQVQGGKPVIPIPPNLVIMYELTILFGVWATFFGFLFGAGLPTRQSKLYSHTVAEDQVGLWVEVTAAQYEAVKKVLKEHRALEIMEH